MIACLHNDDVQNVFPQKLLLNCFSPKKRKTLRLKSQTFEINWNFELFQATVPRFLHQRRMRSLSLGQRGQMASRLQVATKILKNQVRLFPCTFKSTHLQLTYEFFGIHVMVHDLKSFLLLDIFPSWLEDGYDRQEKWG